MAPQSADYSFYASVVMFGRLDMLGNSMSESEWSRSEGEGAHTRTELRRGQMRKHLERLHRTPAPPVAGSWHRAVTQVVGWGVYVSGMSFSLVVMLPHHSRLPSCYQCIQLLMQSFLPLLFHLFKYLFYTPKKTFLKTILAALMNIAVII